MAIYECPRQLQRQENLTRDPTTLVHKEKMYTKSYSNLNLIDTAEGSSADVQESRSLAPINVGSSKKRLKLSLTKLKKVATGKENCARFDF